MNSDKKNIIILTPIFNDWESFEILVEGISRVAEQSELINTHKVVGIDDGSYLKPQYHIEDNLHVKIIHLTHNVGHQKAVALGLSYLANEESCFDYVVVMDSDGEDGPEDIENLLYESMRQPGKIVFARRSKRNENCSFKFFYIIYKLIFKILTGGIISFGNFSIIPKHVLQKLVNVPEIWNHYASGVIKSKIPYAEVSVERRSRICGVSKMNFNSLILHGLSAISVQIDIVSVRIIIATFFMMLFAVTGILIVAGIRMFADINLPGWATYVSFALIIVLMQTIVISLILVFIVLNHRTQKLFIPIKDYKDYMLKV